jgi:NAD+ diphosphatase
MQKPPAAAAAVFQSRTCSVARYAFQQQDLQRLDHLRDDAQALQNLWQQAQLLIVTQSGEACHLGSVEQPQFLSAVGVSETRDLRAVFLGEDDVQRPWFAIAAEHCSELPTLRSDLRTVAAVWPAMQARAFAQARAMLFWQQRHRFCGECSGAIEFARAGHVARCTQCRAEHYPRTDLAIIVAVTDGEHLLLGRQASWPPERWSVLAGFLEPGESLEEAVAREVLEESGVRITSANYFASQPWPFPASLMVGFHARAEPQTAQAGDELEQVRWFSLNDMQTEIDAGTLKLSPAMSISRSLIDDWITQQKTA